MENKVVVITGASRGIGAAIARAFARERSRLVLNGRDKHALESVVKELQTTEKEPHTIVADITKRDGMKKIVDSAYDTFGRIDIFVNNAGVGFGKNIADFSEQEYDLTMDTNLKAVFYCFKELLPRMVAQGQGHIINVSSLASRQGLPGMAVYSASKAALNALSEGVAGEVRNDNIKISVLCPGSVATTFGSGTRDSGRVTESGKIRLTAEEVADGVIFMAMQGKNAFTSYMDMRPLITKGGGK